MKILDKTKKAPEFEKFALFVEFEAERREAERKMFREKYSGKMENFQNEYQDIEVGAIRQTIDRKLMDELEKCVRDGKRSLLDYGSGGSVGKEKYFTGKFERVCASDINREFLKEIQSEFPNVELWYTSNGMINELNEFDVILSSSVVGYILPIQAIHHIQCIYNLLKPGGRMILTRVAAMNIQAFRRSMKFQTVKEWSFLYRYTKKELQVILKNMGFINLRYIPLGIVVPGIPMKWNQLLYKKFPVLMSTVLGRLMPFMRFQHMLVAEKA